MWKYKKYVPRNWVCLSLLFQFRDTRDCSNIYLFFIYSDTVWRLVIIKYLYKLWRCQLFLSETAVRRENDKITPEWKSASFWTGRAICRAYVVLISTDARRTVDTVTRLQTSHTPVWLLAACQYEVFLFRWLFKADNVTYQRKWFLDISHMNGAL